MKLNSTATWIAVFYNLVNALFWWKATTMTGGSSLGFVFIYPAFWLFSLVIVIILAIKYRRLWFSRARRFSTILALFFCTPFPFIGVMAISISSTYCESSGFNTVNGKTIKFEEWVYRSGGINVIKYWKADVPDCNECDTVDFKRDSAWVYLSKKGDTIKIEIYKDGRLIKEVKK